MSNFHLWCETYKRNKYRHIESLKHKKPQDFWRLFSKNRRKASDQISIEDFFQHFRTIATEINEVRDTEAEAFCAQNENGDCLYEDLDCIISTKEVKTVIKSLKHSKSPGEDNVLNEYFIEEGDILTLSSCMSKLFTFVNCRQFMYLVSSLLVLRAGYGV